MTGSPDRVEVGGFLMESAVTRSMLGWGVLAGPIYLLAGVLLAITRDGFDFSEHQLSLLMLGEHGWIQRANLILSGVLCAVAALGFHRAMRRIAPSRAPFLLGVFAVGLVGSGIFAPDPLGGFPPGAEAETTASGLLHLFFGLVQFLSLAVACFVAARWVGARGDAGWATFSRVSGAVVAGGFLGGAALAQSSVGVGLLWLAVLMEFAWLAATSCYLWGTVPHPDAHRRHATTKA